MNLEQAMACETKTCGHENLIFCTHIDMVLNAKKEKRQLANKKYYENNKDKCKELSYKWKEEHRDRFREILRESQKRRHSKTEPKLCKYCGKRLIKFTKTEDSEERDFHKKCVPKE